MTQKLFFGFPTFSQPQTEGKPIKKLIFEKNMYTYLIS